MEISRFSDKGCFPKLDREFAKNIILNLHNKYRDHRDRFRPAFSKSPSVSVF